jgi:hypothetical protein
MRDLLSKLDALISETALKDKEDLEAKRKALADLEADPVASKDPEISAAIDQRRSDLEKEAETKGFAEGEIDDSWMNAKHQEFYKKNPHLKRNNRDRVDVGDRLATQVKPSNPQQVKKKPITPFGTSESFEVGDEFGISFSEDFEIATHIVDILEDGIVIELDDTAMEYLALEGFTYEDGELVEGVAGPQSCWKGYRKVGTKPGTGKNAGKRVNDCEKIDEYFQFEFPKGKDRGPRDHGTDELERREKSFRKHELAKDGRDYKDAMSPKSKSPFKGKYNIAGPKGKLPEDAVAEGSAHGYNVARYYEKYNDQKKITNWLRTNAGLDKTAPVYFDDADLVFGDQTIVPDALVNPKYKMSDLLAAVVQAAESGNVAEGAVKDLEDDLKNMSDEEFLSQYKMSKADARQQSSSVSEAEYQGRNVPLGKPMAGDVKKSKVYVKNPQGNVVKVNFGDKKMRIKKSNPNRRKSFRARHNCANPGPRHKARYWSCRAW